MDKVNCRLSIPETPGVSQPNDEIHVGRHHLLTCEGLWDKGFDFSQAQVKLDESQKYLIKVLKAEARSAQEFDVDFTVYVAGELKMPDFILVDGLREISLGAQNFKVASVLEQTADGKPQKPFGPLFPLKLEWPLAYTLILAALIVLTILAVLLRIRRAARYVRLMAGLREHNSSVPADLQFYKALRIAEKNQYPLIELERAFRLYVLRRFEVPMFVLNNRQISRFFKKRRSGLKNERRQITKILSEFEELGRKESSASGPATDGGDKGELVRKLHRFVDQHPIKEAP